MEAYRNGWLSIVAPLANLWYRESTIEKLLVFGGLSLWEIGSLTVSILSASGTS